jgi:small neutral amino acid transporter SnatA (MarC family)
MSPFESVLVTLAALLPIVNPLGTAPIFLAMSIYFGYRLLRSLS